MDIIDIIVLSLGIASLIAASAVAFTFYRRVQRYLSVRPDPHLSQTIPAAPPAGAPPMPFVAVNRDEPEWSNQLQWAFMILACIGLAWVPWGLFGISDSLSGIWKFIWIPAPLGLVYAAISWFQKMGKSEDEDERKRGLVKIPPMHVALIYMGKKLLWSIGRRDDNEVNGFLMQSWLTWFGFFKISEMLNLALTVVNYHVGEKDGIPFGRKKRSDSGADCVFSIEEQAMDPIHFLHLANDGPKLRNEQVDDLAAQMFDGLEALEMSGLKSLLRRTRIQPDYYDAILASPDPETMDPDDIVRQVPLVLYRADYPDDDTYNAAVADVLKQDRLIREEIIPALVTFLLERAIKLRIKVSTIGSQDVNFKDQKLREELDRAVAAEHKAAADKTEAEGIKKMREAEAAGDVARKKADGEAAAAANAAIPTSVTVWAPGGNVGPMVGGGTGGSGGSRGGGRP